MSSALARVYFECLGTGQTITLNPIHVHNVLSGRLPEKEHTTIVSDLEPINLSCLRRMIKTLFLQLLLEAY